MNNLMDAFYTSVGKTLVADMLKDDGEYLVRISRQDDAVKRLTADLGENAASRVDDLLVEQMAIGELREGAYFRAGFRLALELAR